MELGSLNRLEKVSNYFFGMGDGSYSEILDFNQQLYKEIRFFFDDVHYF